MTAADTILPVLGGAVAVLACLAVLAAAVPARPVVTRTMGFTMAALAALAAGLAVAVLLDGVRAVLPLGQGVTLAVDPIAASFLLPLGLAGIGAGCYGAGDRLSPLAPGLLAAAMLTVVAADGATLFAGFGLVLAVSWLLGLDRPWAVPVMLVAAVSLVGALALLAAGGDLQFATIRTAAALDGWRAALVLTLAIVAAAAAIGLPVRHAQPSASVAVLTNAATGPVGLYLLARLLFDLSGPATPSVWGVPLLVLGSAAAVAGAWIAARAISVPAVPSGMALQAHGLVAAGFGVALVARGADLPLLAGFAATGALLAMATHALFGTLAVLACHAAAAGGGSSSLDRLGGLVRGMPMTAACLMVAAASAAGLPLSAGFAGLWAVLQALVAAPRIGGLPLQLVLLASVAALGLATGLGATAAVRLVGIALLGRSRTPRAAAAEDAPPIIRAVLVGFAGLTLAVGVLPGPVMRLLGGDGMPWWTITPPADAPGYGPLGVLLLLALVAAAILAALRRSGPAVAVPMWQDGFAAPPPWMPFGDPATQYTATSLTQPLADLLPRPAWSRLGWGQVQPPPLLAAVAALALVLLAAAWLAP